MTKLKTINELEIEKKRIPKPQSHQYTNDEWYSVVNEKIKQLKDVNKLIKEFKCCICQDCRKELIAMINGEKEK